MAEAVTEAGQVSGTRSALSAVLFMQPGMAVFQVFGTLNSSPWTTENVGGDEQKMASLREYVTHAAGFSTAYLVASAIIGKSPWPIYGALVTNAYLIWIYRRAAQRGSNAGSTGEGWFDSWGKR